MYRLIPFLLLPLSLLAQDDADRNWRHEVNLINGFTRALPDAFYDCGFDWRFCQGSDTDKYTQVSTCLTYHYLRPVGRFWLGGGGGLAGMGTGLRERFGLLSGILEYQTGERRVRTLGRLEAGLNLPIGSRRLPIRSRELGTVVHPSLGLAIALGEARKRVAVITLGYRFSRTNFSLENMGWQGGKVNRQMTYRRLALTAGFRF